LEGSGGKYDGAKECTGTGKGKNFWLDQAYSSPTQTLQMITLTFNYIRPQILTVQMKIVIAFTILQVSQLSVMVESIIVL